MGPIEADSDHSQWEHDIRTAKTYAELITRLKQHGFTDGVTDDTTRRMRATEARLTAAERIIVGTAATFGLAATIRFLGWSSPTWNRLLILFNAPGTAIAWGQFCLFGAFVTHFGTGMIIAIPLLLIANPVAWAAIAHGAIRLRHQRG
jgi:hypothetical protein